MQHSITLKFLSIYQLQNIFSQMESQAKMTEIFLNNKRNLFEKKYILYFNLQATYQWNINGISIIFIF